MFAIRPTKESMQIWADSVNDTSYLFDEVLPYYKKSTQFTPPDTTHRFSNATAGYDEAAFDSDAGPLQVTYSNYAMPFSTWMKLGLEAIGISEASDFNLGSLFGAQYCSSTIKPGDQSRSSSETSFLGSKPGSNLHIYTQTLAKKILFNNQKEAIGVEVTSGLLGLKTQILAEKEVILSAGAFQSPQLLMVSGIGPSTTLKDYAIEVLSDLPGVGQNMWDHPFIGPAYRVAVETFTKPANNLLYIGEKFVEYETLHTGVLTSPISDFLGWEKIPQSLRSKFSTATTRALSWFSNDWPEVEVSTQSLTKAAIRC